MFSYFEKYMIALIWVNIVFFVQVFQHMLYKRALSFLFYPFLGALYHIVK